MIEVVNLWAILQDAADDKPVDQIKLARTLAALAAAIDSAQEFFPNAGLHFASPRVHKFYSKGLGSAVAVLDLVLAARGAHDAWQAKDYSVVAGNAVQFVGGGMALAATIFAATAWAGPVAVAAVAVGIGATLIIELTAETQMELWVEHNYFGKRWSAVGTVESPDHLYFLFRTPDGKPNFPRQISGYFSVLQPVPFTVEAKSEVLNPPNWWHWMEIHAPANAGFEGTRLLVKRVVEENVPGDSQPRQRVRPLLEIEVDSFTKSGDNLVWKPPFGGPAGANPLFDRYTPFDDWTLEIDVVAKDHPPLDWASYTRTGQDDPHYLAPYLTVRRVRKGG
jgi:hypothetical protein